MKTIAFICQKGGSGKTTLAVNLALAAVLRKKTVLIIDTDPQGSALAWFGHRQQQRGNAPEVATIKADMREIPLLLKEAKKGKADLVLIDTAGHSSKTTLAAAELADFVLVPCVPTSLFDIEAMTQTFDIFRLTKTPAALVFNKCRAGAFARDMRENLEGQGFKIVPPCIAARTSVEWATFYGQSVSEYEPENQAAQDIDALYLHLKERLKL